MRAPMRVCITVVAVRVHVLPAIWVTGGRVIVGGHTVPTLNPSCGELRYGNTF